MVREFIAAHRDEIIGRCRTKVAMRSVPCATQPGLEHELPMVVTQLLDTHEYGDICQVITELALETNARGSERLAFLTRELRNLTDTAMAALETLKTENAGDSGKALHRNLMRIRSLVGRSIFEVRSAQQTNTVERFCARSFIDELAPEAALSADAAHLTLAVTPVDDGLAIEADRLVLKAVVMNLLRNAFKFTQPGSNVTLRVGSSAERVLFEVQDACGGLADGDAESLFRRFERRPLDRTGSGLPLSFSRWAVEANNGRIYGRDLPGAGCVFTVDLPRLPPSVLGGH